MPFTINRYSLAAITSGGAAKVSAHSRSGKKLRSSYPLVTADEIRGRRTPPSLAAPNGADPLGKRAALGSPLRG